MFTPSSTQPSRIDPRLIGVLVLAALVIFAYAPTLQTIINGSEHPAMIDVGETQVVLNVWGTLHATGYPHYVIVSSALTALLKLFGFSPAAAPTITSLIYGLAALALLYWLMFRISKDALAVGAVVLIFGLTRNLWLHHVIAEIYTFGLLITVGLLALALWTAPGAHPTRTRTLYALALLGGIGVAHHRALVMLIPALLYAVFPIIRAQGRKLPRVLAVCVLLGLLGFLPYAYLMLRAQAGAAWVYGEPGTLSGLWDQFIGREAARFIGGVSSLDGLIANFGQVTGVLLTDMHPLGVLVGVFGLIVGVLRVSRRRIAVTLILCGTVSYLFHVFFYTDILAALIITVELALAFGWLFIAEIVFAPFDYGALPVLPSWATLIGLAAFAAFGLGSLHFAFIDELTGDETGVHTMDTYSRAPEHSTLMIAWGPRHFAAGFARDVLGQRTDITLVDHKADFRAALARGSLVTPDYTFYRFPLEWWDQQAGGQVYLRASAPGLIEIDDTPVITDVQGEATGALSNLVCTRDQVTVAIEWITPQRPTTDYSVFVHFLDADGALVAQADQPTPVYAAYPTSRWSAGETVIGIYSADRAATAGAVSVRYGWYTQGSDGSFINVIEAESAFDCP